MHTASTYGNGFDIAVTVADLAEFAAKWPCFGSQVAPINWRGGALLFSFDRRNGDLTDVQGDEGLDAAGVTALAQDALEFAVTVYEIDEATARRA